MTSTSSSATSRGSDSHESASSEPTASQPASRKPASDQPTLTPLALLRDPILLPLLIGTALCEGVFLLDLGDDVTQLRTFWSVVPFFNLLLWMISRRLASPSDTPAPARRFWRVLSIAGLLFAAGDISQLTLAWLRPGPATALPNPFHFACVLLGNGAIIWAVLSYPTPAVSRQARIRFWLDGAAVVIGTGVLVWFLTAPRSDGSPTAAALLGAVILMVTAVATVKLLLAVAPMGPAAAVPMLTAAALQGFTGGLASTDTDQLHLVLAARLLPAALLCTGPRIHEVWLRRDPHYLERQGRGRYNLLPYMAMLGMYALLPAVLPPGLDSRAWVTIAGLLATTCLVLGRQLLVSRENASLVAQLDASLLELSRQEARMRRLLEHSSDITSIVDKRGRFRYLTPATDRVLGRDHREMIGSRVTDYIHPEDLARLMPQMVELMITPNATLTYQARYRHADGSWRWLDVVSRNLMLEPEVGGVVSNARDVTEARLLQDQLRHQASHDALTGLPNHALFAERLAAAANGLAAILVIDLDDFKWINDTYGHHIGDKVLIGVADRLHSVMPEHGTPARLGGDEFGVLLPGADAPRAGEFATRFLDVLNQPMEIEGRQLQVRASVGLVAGDTAEAEMLLRQADAAMYRAKRNRKACGGEGLGSQGVDVRPQGDRRMVMPVPRGSAPASRTPVD